MTGDARFEDGADRPLRLRASAPDDLQIMAALVQDAVFPITEMKWDRQQRRFAILLNRFRWEEMAAAERAGRAFERVQSIVAIGDVARVSSSGLDLAARDSILSLLDLTFRPGEDGTGRIVLTLAGDGAVAVEVEALDVLLRDVTRPYAAPSGKAPEHPE